MTEAEMQELEDMVALRDARRRSWLLTTTAGAAVRVRIARRRGDGNTPSSPAEVTTLGTPQINPTPRALFPGSPTPRKGLKTICHHLRSPHWVTVCRSGRRASLAAARART